MYRVIAIVVAGLSLAACSSTPEWMSIDALKPAPLMDTVRFESTPPGAEAKTSNGQTCRTPCALALPTNAPLSVTFALNGYMPEQENLEIISVSGTDTKLEPNPVVVELSPAAPPPKPVKKPVAKKKVSAKKPAPKPAVAAKPPAPAAAPPAQPQSQPAGASPWPAPPPKQ
jgi:hypothetical protein